jgi:hypothetical protein
MNSDTPRTDNAACDGTTVPADFAADLERELTAAKAEVELRALLERRRKKHEATFLELVIARRERAEAVQRAEKAKAEVERLREVAELALEALDSDHPYVQLRAALALRAALKETK